MTVIIDAAGVTLDETNQTEEVVSLAQLRIFGLPIQCYSIGGNVNKQAVAPRYIRIFGLPATFQIVTTLHPIQEARYLSEPILVSRVYVIGMDSDGNMVYGEDSTTQNIEVIKAYPDQMITNSEDADIVATNILIKDALTCDRGHITIMPHVGLELWDVISCEDMDETAVNLRVSGWTFDYDNGRMGEPARYEQKINLTSNGRNV